MPLISLSFRDLAFERYYQLSKLPAIKVFFSSICHSYDNRTKTSSFRRYNHRKHTSSIFCRTGLVAISETHRTKSDCSSKTKTQPRAYVNRPLSRPNPLSWRLVRPTTLLRTMSVSIYIWLKLVPTGPTRMLYLTLWKPLGISISYLYVHKLLQYKWFLFLNY